MNEYLDFINKRDLMINLRLIETKVRLQEYWKNLSLDEKKEIVDYYINNICNDSQSIEFIKKISLKTKDLISLELIKNIDYKEKNNNEIICYENSDKLKLVLEKGVGLCRFDIADLSYLKNSKIIFPETILNEFKMKNKKKNATPYCVEFVKLKDDLKVSHLQNSELNKTLNLAPYFNPVKHYSKYVKSLPVLFVYKKDKNKIDVFLDNIKDFEQYKNDNMAILSGVNVNELEGIIVFNKAIDILKTPYFDSSKKLINYFIRNYPDLYISNELGHMIYVPENKKVKKK